MYSSNCFKVIFKYSNASHVKYTIKKSETEVKNFSLVVKFVGENHCLAKINIM